MRQTRVDDYDCVPSYERPATDEHHTEARDQAGRLFRYNDRVRHTSPTIACTGRISGLSVYPCAPREIYKIQVRWDDGGFGSHWPENISHADIVTAIGRLDGLDG